MEKYKIPKVTKRSDIPLGEKSAETSCVNADDDLQVKMAQGINAGCELPGYKITKDGTKSAQPSKSNMAKQSAGLNVAFVQQSDKPEASIRGNQRKRKVAKKDEIFEPVDIDK